MTNPWIQLVSGRPFYLLNPCPEDFEIADIAHALANLARFNGHTKRFYSVAEHSLLVTSILRHWGHPIEVLRQGLLHDAAEAYIGDIVKPLKDLLPALKPIEERIERALSEQFALGYPWHPAVKLADNVALNIEREQVLGKGTGQKQWGSPVDKDVANRCWKGHRANFRAAFKAKALQLGL